MNRRAFLTSGIAAGAALAAAPASSVAGTAVEENKALARRFTVDLWGKRNVALIDQLLSPDFLSHDPFPGLPADREGERKLLAVHIAAWADAESTVEDQIAEGEKVVTRWTFAATHKGEFLGIAPTGKRVKIKGINIHRIEGGKIVELWREVDAFGLLRQLGAVPRRPK
jgi:steroid delta-isomerase-like uncharacterized protein